MYLVDLNMNCDKILVSGSELEVTEYNIWRYMIPYIKDYDHIVLSALLDTAIRMGYLSIVKRLMEEDIHVSEITIRFSEVHNKQKITEYLKLFLQEHTHI